MFKAICITLVLCFSAFLVNLSTGYVLPGRTGEVESGSDEIDASSLYHGSDKMTILNSSNFRREIFGEQKHKLWLVEFYNHWCGYCIRFVPVMKAFSTDIYDWRDLAAVGSMDCANPTNNEICRNHEIKKVPSLRTFPPNSEENFLGFEFGRGSETTITEMRERLAQILKSYHNSQDTIDGPVNLKLLRHSSLDGLWNETPPTVVYLMLVFEPKDSLVGSQVALDLSRTPAIRVRLVDPKNKNLTDKVGVGERNTGAVILERNSYASGNSQFVTPEESLENNDLTSLTLNDQKALDKETTISSSEPSEKHVVFRVLQIEEFTREELNKAARKYLISRGVNIAPELPNIPIVHTNVSVNEIKEAIERENKLKQALNTHHLSAVVFQMDIEGAIIYAMTNEITLNRNITREQLDSLRNFMTIVIKYFPTGEQGKRFFTELREKGLDNKDSVCGEDFKNIFEELKQKYNPFMSNTEWVGCRGTIPSLRGYPCSVWTLFHTLVAVEELKDREIPEETPEVLNAMAGYIKNFFSCSPCADHFNQMAKTIPGNVTSQRDAVMWLWRAHNNVNLRLAGDLTEDPRHHKVQFPTKATCPSCYTDDGSWDEAHVFTFITHMFTNISQLNPHNLPHS